MRSERERPVNARASWDAESGGLCLRLLGRFTASAGGRSIDESAWRLRKAGHLVKLLALAPGHALHREQIIDQLWPDRDPEVGASNLRYTLHVARRILAGLPIAKAHLLRAQAGRILLYPADALSIDVDRFTAAAAAARSTRNLTAYRAALALYTGDLLPEDRYEDWAAGARERLRELYCALLIEFAHLCQEAGDADEAIEALQRAVEVDPAHEAAHAQLMTIYARTGRRHQALRQYQRLRNRLREELDATPDPATQRLYESLLGGQASTAEAARSNTPERRTNLPIALTSFIGRERDLAQTVDLLHGARLVTLIGLGGVGKTRLALAVAGRLAGAFADGVWFVDLAPLDDPDLLAATVATTLGIPEDGSRPLDETLTSALRARDILLILDNCEHLAAACAALVDDLAGACPRLRILATSREPLHVQGERVWRIGPLDLPDSDDVASLAQVARNEAVRLFVERATLVEPTFTLTERNVAAVVEICRRLEGLPLAIELAAARCSTMAIAPLAARLDDTLDLLASASRTAPPRQQTLRATLDWSYRLLSPEEQRLWRRLAVFRGPWSLDAAEAVAAEHRGEARDVALILAQLVHKSLVAVDIGADEAHYHLLDLVRRYATERLEESGEAHQVRARHARYYLTLAETAEPALAGADQAGWLRRLERVHDNLRGALHWFTGTDETTAGLRLAGALARFWWARGHYREGRAWLTSLLARAGAAAPLDVRAKALAGAFLLAYRQGDYSAAVSFGERHLGLQRELGDRQGIAWALIHLAMPVGELGDIDRSRTLLEQGLDMAREIGDSAGVARALSSLGEIARLQQDHGRAAELYTESLALWREVGDRQYIAMTLHNLAYVALMQGDLDSAAAHFQDSLRRYHELQNLDGIAACLTGIASVASGAGQAGQAIRLFAAADALRTAIGSPEDAADRVQSQRYVARAQAQLGDTTATTIWSIGSSLSTEAAVTEALAFAIPTDPTPTATSGLAALSPRELEVAALIGAGSTNQQISTLLGITRRTTTTHVSNILRKLGLSSRAEVADWAIRHDLLPPRPDQPS